MLKPYIRRCCVFFVLTSSVSFSSCLSLFLFGLHHFTVKKNYEDEDDDVFRYSYANVIFFWKKLSCGYFVITLTTWIAPPL